MGRDSCQPHCIAPFAAPAGEGKDEGTGQARAGSGNDERVQPGAALLGKARRPQKVSIGCRCLYETGEAVHPETLPAKQRQHALCPSSSAACIARPHKPSHQPTCTHAPELLSGQLRPQKGPHLSTTRQSVVLPPIRASERIVSSRLP